MARIALSAAANYLLLPALPFYLFSLPLFENAQAGTLNQQSLGHQQHLHVS